MTLKVCVLILNLNGKQHLEYCLPSVVRTEYSNLEIVLVDNNSSDDSVGFTRANFPQVNVLQNPKNLGWAAGNNAGIRYALERGADFLLVMNNDTTVQADMLDELMAYAGAPDVGILAPKIYYFDEPERIWSVGCAMLMLRLARQKRFESIRSYWRGLRDGWKMPLETVVDSSCRF